MAVAIAAVMAATVTLLQRSFPGFRIAEGLHIPVGGEGAERDGREAVRIEGEDQARDDRREDEDEDEGGVDAEHPAEKLVVPHVVRFL
jgi:hypothetical protein